MLRERIEGKWIDCFVRTFELCKIKPGDTVAILSETQSRPVTVQLAELAALRLGAMPFHVVMPTPPVEDHIPVRSTGRTLAVQELPPVVAALSQASIVIDVTVEGMLHTPELKKILAAGSRLFMISDEHPEVLERLMPDPRLREKIELGVKMIGAAKEMRVTSDAGTDLRVNLESAFGRGSAGFVDQPGRVSYWPAGLCLCFPKPHSANGVVVLAPGDANLTFKRYVERPITLRIEDDYVVAIEGEGLDAELMRSYYAVWNDRDAYAVSHVGWGMNPAARWDSLVMYDKRDVNGTELRAFAGNFLFSTGANEEAARFSRGHFDLPMRNCTVSLDNTVVVEKGRVLPPLA